VNHIVRVEIKSRHRPVRSNAVDIRTLEGTRARARNVELNELAVFIAHEAVIHICLVNIPSGDRSIRIDSERIGTLEGPRDVTAVRSVERGEGAIPIHQKTVAQIVRVKIVSHDGSIRCKSSASRTLTGACAGARNIECGDDALPIPQEAVGRIGSVNIESCDLPT